MLFRLICVKIRYKTGGGDFTDSKFILKLWDENAEEARALRGLPLDASIYFEDKSLIKSEKILGSARHGVGIKPHPRFAAFPEHGHNYVEMTVVLSGTLTHKIGDRVIVLTEGDVLLMNKHVRHSISKAGEGDLGINVIMTDGFFNSLSPELPTSVFSGFLKDNEKRDGVGAYLHFSTKKNRQVQNLIENILLELTETKANDTVIFGTLTLFFSCLSASQGLLMESSVPSDSRETRKEKILSYIKSSYRTASLEELAGILFLSPIYLSGIITEYFGKSFGRLLIDERLSRADMLITRTDMPISEVIRSVGYENASFFHREYKKRFGKTPLTRRNECK